MQSKFKKGDFIRIKTITPWQTSEFGWDGPAESDSGKYGLILDLYHSPFDRVIGYETWTIRLIDGTLGVYAANNLLLAAKS
jgi:hypothetical protein